MKRIIATILALTLLSALAVIGVSATDFVPSTDAWEVRLVSAEANGEDVTSKIIVTHYKDRDALSAEKKAALEAAYEEILKGVSNVTGDSNSALVALGALVVCTAAAATVVLKKRSF